MQYLSKQLYISSSPLKITVHWAHWTQILCWTPHSSQHLLSSQRGYNSFGCEQFQLLFPKPLVVCAILSRRFFCPVASFSEVFLKLISCHLPRDLKRKWGREEILFFEAIMPFFCHILRLLNISLTMLVLGAVPGAPRTVNLFPCWELDLLLQLFDFYVIVCFQPMKELLPLISIKVTH